MLTNPIPEQVTLEPAVAERVWLEGRNVFLALVDGRIVGFPADRYRRLKAATNTQLLGVLLRRGGEALRWPELDEDLTVDGILRGEFELPLSDSKNEE